MADAPGAAQARSWAAAWSVAMAMVLAIVLAIVLAGCATRQPEGAVSPQAPPAHAAPSAHLGRPFEVVAGESSLVVRVYRAGPLAALGHNHVISCRCITGRLYLSRDPLRGSFDLHVAVDQLTVDDPALRAAEHSADFPPDVPQSARQGTRHNMLGDALLYAARYPQILLRTEGLRARPDGKPGDLIAEVMVQVRGRSHSVAVPVHYDIEADRIVATGEFSLKQTALGLTPLSLMAGALRVRDAMTVRFRLVAQRRGP
jgi:hypothetical protein